MREEEEHEEGDGVGNSYAFVRPLNSVSLSLRKTCVGTIGGSVNSQSPPLPSHLKGECPGWLQRRASGTK